MKFDQFLFKKRSMAEESRAKSRANNFGMLRLLFASLVIVSHSPELIDGNRSRELLTQIFGTMSFGEVAVDGFFLISGYLISQSLVEARGTRSFCIKRVARIVPGYLAALALCTFVLAPLVGVGLSVFSKGALWQCFTTAARLLPPATSGVFQNVPYHSLNGAMWTIAYEARCYVAVVLCGLVFRTRPRSVILLVALVGMSPLATSLKIFSGVHVSPQIASILGDIEPTCRFAGVFGCGALFYLARRHLVFTAPLCLASLAILLIAMPFRLLAEPALAIFGGYLIFYVAFATPKNIASRFVERMDCSYGLYLYAWPVGCTLIYLKNDIAPVVLCILTLGIAGLLGATSWVIVEKPAILFGRKLDRMFRGARPYTGTVFRSV